MPAMMLFDGLMGSSLRPFGVREFGIRHNSVEVTEDLLMKLDNVR